MRFQPCLAKRKHSVEDENCHDNVEKTTVEVRGKSAEVSSEMGCFSFLKCT